MFQLALILAATVALGVHGQTSNYSMLSCGRDNHTMVGYPPVGPKCSPRLAFGVNANDTRIILLQHNALRRRVANGSEVRGNPGPQPPAANMRLLSWDAELATVAQRWADQCTFGHDICRRRANSSVGQNIYLGLKTAAESKANWTAAINSWTDEVALFDKNNVFPYKFSAATGHYTQVVWANTYLVGCGYTQFKDTVSPTFIKSLYVCNYASAGNVIGSPIYKVGTACSQCPAGTTCSSVAEGLCA